MEGLTGGRERHPPGRPGQQPRSDAGLELLELSAQHLLGDVQPTSGPGEAQLFSEHDVPVQQLDAHVQPQAIHKR